MSDDFDFLGKLRGQLQYAIQWLPKGSIGPMQVRPSETVGQVLTTTANGAEWQASPAGVTDHGLLSGLADDDHTQYHNDTRGDARYWQLSTDLATQAEFDTHKSSSDHDGRYYTETEVDTALGLKAPLASPAFTGTPSLPTAATAVTQAEGDASTKLATTQFVQTATGSASSNRPVCRLNSPLISAAGQVGSGTETFIDDWSVEVADNDSMHSTSSNKGRITVQTAGTYALNARIFFNAAATTGTVYVGITHKNSGGTTVTPTQCATDSWINSGTIGTVVECSAIIPASSGDYFGVVVYQNTGATRAWTATSCEFSAAWVGGTGAAWGNAAVRAYNSGTQNLTTGVDAAITFDSENFDTDGLHSTSSNTSRITCVTPGMYQFTGMLGIAGGTGGTYRQAYLRVNGSTIYGLVRKEGVASQTYLVTSALLSLVAGDYVELVGGQDSGGTLATVAGNGSPSLSAVRVGYQTNPADLPGTYIAKLVAANSGAPTHTSNGGWQKVGSGGGTLTWVAEIDKRPSGVTAQADTSTNKRIDIRKTGLYRVDWGGSFSAISDGKIMDFGVYKNGALMFGAGTTNGVAATPQMHRSELASLTSGDYLELYAYQNDSASEAYYTATGYQPHVSAEYLGPAT